MCTIPAVRELVIIISDLYLPHAEQRDASSVVMPGLEHASRFAERSGLTVGWRPWLARWIGGEDVADLAPATIAAAAIASRQGDAPGARAAASATVWMATPVHLLASLTSLHLDRRSVLRLSAAECTTLACEFERLFHDSGFVLEPLDSGEFLLFGPPLPQVDTSEPARAMGESVAERLPGGAGAAALRGLGAEIEMWLHEHAVNDARIRQGQPAITALWLWGGGAAEASVPHPDGGARTGIAFGSDAYLRGLWIKMGGNARSLPNQLAEIFSYPSAQRAVLVLDVGQMLHSNPRWTVLEAVACIDGRFIAPAVQALHQAALERLQILANDVRLSLRARDRLKFWRRAAPGLSGLL